LPRSKELNTEGCFFDYGDCKLILHSCGGGPTREKV